jgi:hypothetical protein
MYVLLNGNPTAVSGALMGNCFPCDGGVDDPEVLAKSYNHYILRDEDVWAAIVYCCMSFLVVAIDARARRCQPWPQRQL